MHHVAFSFPSPRTPRLRGGNPLFSTLHRFRPFTIAPAAPLCYPPFTNPARRATPMLIRIGYDLVFDLPAPAPMLLMLSVRPEVFPALRRQETFRVEPFAPVTFFTDSF